MQDKDIKGLRLEFGLSQERFARLLGVSLQTVRRWEEGLTRPLPIISLRLEELRRERDAARQGKGGIPMDRSKGSDRRGLDIDLGGLFKGMGNLFDTVARMAEEGQGEHSRTGEREVFGGKAKAVYGFSVRVGLGGKPVVEQFGNVRATEEGTVVAGVREPLVDVLDEGDELVVIAELPGVEAGDIRVGVKGDILELSAETRDRNYHKEILLPSPVATESMETSYKNGILEIRLKKQ